MTIAVRVLGVIALLLTGILVLSFFVPKNIEDLFIPDHCPSVEERQTIIKYPDWLWTKLDFTVDREILGLVVNHNDHGEGGFYNDAHRAAYLAQSSTGGSYQFTFNSTDYMMNRNLTYSIRASSSNEPVTDIYFGHGLPEGPDFEFSAFPRVQNLQINPVLGFFEIVRGNQYAGNVYLWEGEGKYKVIGAFTLVSAKLYDSDEKKFLCFPE